MAEPLEYEIRAIGGDEASREAREFARALRDVEDAAEDYAGAAEEAEGASGDFAEALELAGRGIAAAATAVATGAAALVAWGDEVEATMGVLNRMPGSVAAAQRAVGGMVSQMDLAIARNRLMQAGLELTDESFASVAEVATDYAAAIGGDVDQAMEQLGEGLLTLSAESLQRFGVEIDASQSRSEQFADALRQLEERAASMQTGADTAGGAWARFKVVLEDATTEAQRASNVIFQQLAPSFDELARAITGSEDALITWEGVASTTEDVFVGLVAAVGASVQTITDIFAMAIHNAREYASALGSVIARIRSGDLGLDPRDIAQALQNTSLNLRGTDQSLVDFFLERLDNNLRATVAEQGRVSRPEPGGNRGTGGGAGPTRSGPTQAEIDAENRQRSLQEEIEYAAAMEQQAADAASAAAERSLSAWSESLDARAEAFRDAAQAQAELAERQKELVDDAREAATSFRDSWRGGVDSVIDALNEANEAAKASGEQMISALEAAGEAAKGAAAQMGESLLGGIANSFAGAAKAAIRGEQDFGKALAGMLEDTLFSIGTQALVLSVFEFAKAIADAASFNAAGAAAHAAAGAAFAAVSALAFAGGAGLSAANAGSASAGGSSSSAPAGPQPSNDNGAGGGNVTYNVFLENTIATAATTAELGRELESYIGQASRRYGRAA